MSKPQKYTETQLHTLQSLKANHSAGRIKVGQWVMMHGGRGQFLGVTRAGVIVVRWQQESPKFSKADAKANRPVRAYARNYRSV